MYVLKERRENIMHYIVVLPLLMHTTSNCKHCDLIDILDLKLVLSLGVDYTQGL